VTVAAKDNAKVIKLRQGYTVAEVPGHVWRSTGFGPKAAFVTKTAAMLGISKQRVRCMSMEEAVNAGQSGQTLGVPRFKPGLFE
jgi:hypothetical protein